MRQGTLIDATLLQAAVKPLSVKEARSASATPRPAGRRRTAKSHFGCKAHVAVDEGSEIIRTAILTSADLHDSQPGGAVDPRRRARRLNSLGGNPMRFDYKQSSIQLDEKWRTELSPEDMALFERIGGKCVIGERT